jgi:signal transduction histidine kinase
VYIAGGGTGFTLLAAILLGIQIRARRVQVEINQALQATADRLRSAQDERRQLSRDLHDGAIQSLYGIQLELGHDGNGSAETVNKGVTPQHSPHSDQQVKDLDLRIDAIISELRRFLVTDELEAALERKVHLDEVLQSFVTRLSRASRARIRFDGDPEVARELTTDQSLQLAFIAHEALSNSLRHAEAKEIVLALQPIGSGRARLMVTDNGCGYRMDGVHVGVGLRSMRQRAEQLSAELRMESAPGQGTRLTVELQTT